MSHKRLPDSLICEFTRYDFPLHFMQNMYLQWVAFLKKQPIQSINMSDTEKEIEFLTQYKSIQTISLGKSLKSQWMLGSIVGEINYYSSLLLLIIINKQSFLMYWNLRQQ